EILEKADVIISKGQGNFEGLYDYHRRSNLFFLLMVKCSEIARVTGLCQGDSVIMNGQRIEENIMADG
ncbi:MAG: ARMT1-like domain-containing protein, partial [Marinilabiliaceae bacterium]